MDGWLKKAAQAAQQHVSGLQELMPDVDGTTAKTAASDTKEFKFGQGALGFTLESMRVVVVQRGTQAARLGVEIGDRLTKVDGKAVPDVDNLCDPEEEKRLEALVDKWLKEMPLPAVLVFKAPTPPPSEAAYDEDDLEDELGVDDDANDDCNESRPETHASGIDDAAEAAGDVAGTTQASSAAAVQEQGDVGEPETSYGADCDASDLAEFSWNPSAEVETQVETVTCAEPLGSIGPEDLIETHADESGPLDAAALQADLRHEQGARVQLYLELQEARKKCEDMSKRLDAGRKQHSSQQRKIKDLEKQLAGTKAEVKELLLGQSRVEAESFDIAEDADARERALTAEVGKLRQTLEAGGLAASEAAEKKAEAAEKKFTEAEVRIAEMREEADRFAKETAANMDALNAKAIDAEARATEAENQAEALRRQLMGFREAHEAELELCREEHRLKEQLHAGKISDQEQLYAELEARSARELQQARGELDEANEAVAKHRSKVEALSAELHAAAVEAAAARREAIEAKAQMAGSRDKQTADGDFDSLEDGGDNMMDAAGTGAAPPRPVNTSAETTALYDRINALERRCVMLQKKLNARPVMSSTPVASWDLPIGSMQRRPSWETWVVSQFGARVGEYAVIAYMVPDLALRTFTQHLLKRNLLMWAFYGHVLVLYLIAVSFTTQTTLAEEANPMEEINLHMGDAAAKPGGA